jgi:hypothetical protein
MLNFCAICKDNGDIICITVQRKRSIIPVKFGASYYVSLI